MQSEKEKKKTVSELSKIKKEIRELRPTLKELNEKKEKAFSEKEEIKKKISELIAHVKETKTERNKFTGDIKGVKKERDRLNKEIARKIKEIKKLNEQKKDFESKHKLKKNPTAIKKEIEILELKIETEVMEFSKEKAIMRNIRDLKKQFEEVKNTSDIWEKSSKLSKEIDKLKAKANALHKSVQGHAKDSQNKHEEMIESSKEIKDLRVQEDKAFKKFFELKQKYIEINKQISEKIKRSKELNGILEGVKEEKREENKKKKEESIKERIKAVEEKIKKGGKLTTEDFMVMQASSK